MSDDELAFVSPSADELDGDVNVVAASVAAAGCPGGGGGGATEGGAPGVRAGRGPGG